MKTINGNATHHHRWRRIGAHTLHAGHKPKGTDEHARPLREVRHVSVCMFAGCKEVRVHIRQEEGFAHDAEHAAAMSQQTRRIPGQTAVSLKRKKKYEYSKQHDPRPGKTGMVVMRVLKAEQLWHRPKAPDALP